MGTILRALVLTVVLLLMGAAQTFAALTVVQHVGSTGNGATAIIDLTVTSTGASHLLVAQALSFDGTTPVNVTGVSDGTNSFTHFTGAALVGSGTFLDVEMDAWYLLSSASGKTNIRVTWPSAVSFHEAEVWEVSGFTTPTTDGCTNNTSGGSTGSGTTDTGPTLTTTSTTGFVFALAGVGTQVTQNPKTGNEFTSGGDITGSDGFVSLISSTAAGHTPVWLNSASADPFIVVVCAFKESGGAPPAPHTLMLTGQGLAQ